MIAPDLISAANTIARDVGAPEQFLTRLLDEDDWSFVIKIHAMLEAGVAQLITEALGRVEMAPFIGRLPVNSERTGKLALLKELDLLSVEYRRYLSAISILRNFYVHSVNNFTTDISDYIKNLDKANRKRFIRDIMLGAPDPARINGRSLSLREFIEDNPRLHIWLSALDFLGHIHLQKASRKLSTNYLDLLSLLNEFPQSS